MTYIYIERTFVQISFLMLFCATLLNSINLFYEFDKLTLFSKRTMIIAFLCTTGFLIIRWFQTKHLPLSNLYESSMFLSWSFSLLYVISKFRNQNGLLGAIAAPSAMPTHAFATLGLPEEMQQSTPLVPASQSHWSMTHVSTTLLSYATLLCGSSLAIPPLSIYYGEIDKYSDSNSSRNYKRRVGLLNIDSNQKQNDAWSPLYLLSLNSRKCQLLNRLDRWVYQAISLGFSFLTIGILSGAVWANEAWGSYRSWDPKETRALVTRSIHATYLHTRVTERWMGEGSAVAASTGFSLVRICFSGVNLLGVGLHNYGWLI
uniref:Cytochrome c biogenesis protein CcsA n=1 Tax=Pteridium aquilinum subsp. aquilinum TaxID=104588 RepID=E2IH61_PTEAA|nr:cytochrome c heme attachment protein [Pteridium aquilinum subsp. aquilinum]ADK47570.1 cytochrome c heme attachment protein [Pteridium aquilinum subsp. aquilinum]